MRNDLDRLMRERGLGGLVALAPDHYSSALYYVTGEKIHDGVYFRTPDGRAHLICNAMERDQAEHAGCEYSLYPQHGLAQRVEREGPARGLASMIAEQCELMGMRGRVAFVGDMEAGTAYELIAAVLERVPGIEPDREHPNILALARVTKDGAELERIRTASRGAVAAMNRLREHLASLRRDGDGYRDNGTGPATIGSLRRLLHREMLDHGLEAGDSIVSQGRDAGVPHNRGDDAQPLRPGAPILVDIFPGEEGGGYHSDLTRTFCLGPAPDDLKRMHAEVGEAHRLAMAAVRPGVRCRDLQEQVCEYFERHGHATQRTDAGVKEGYVHGLGHGVGLAVHEPPRLGGPPSNTRVLEPGMVVSVEPGLYYPSRGLGVRIEDLVAIDADGRVENLTPVSYELEIMTR